jgi:formylglycine-generating enzyme required for sulfatase activity
MEDLSFPAEGKLVNEVEGLSMRLLCLLFLWVCVSCAPAEPEPVDDLCDTVGDTDGDGICDDADLCSGNDARGDTDADGVCDDLDRCIGDDASGDADKDQVCDDADLCWGNDASGDNDADGVCDDVDACPGFDDGLDVDGDGTPDGCDVETCDDRQDNDGDGRSDCLDPDCSAAGACLPAGFALIPAGTFAMGSSLSEVGRESDEDLHEVTLTRSFHVGRTAVTESEFESLMGWRPSAYAPCPSCPVEGVTWFEAVAFANEQSVLDGLVPCYDLSFVTCWDGLAVGTAYLSCMNTAQAGIRAAAVAPNGVATPYECEGYRLPTEAEWEYAARAGETAAFPNGGNAVASTAYSCTAPVTLDNGETLDSIAWYCGNSSSSSHPVGGLLPNAWGLFDTSGNVWEWTWDLYDVYPAGPLVDPVGPPSLPATRRAIRGGSWSYAAHKVRSANRGWGFPTYRLPCGFRLALTQP